MSSAQRVREHRARMKIENFKHDYAKNKELLSTLDFVDAKELEFCILNNVASVSFHTVFITSYMKRMLKHGDSETLYKIENHLAAWELSKESE